MRRRPRNNGLRQHLGGTVRSLRKGALLTQERLGDKARLSGKFIGEVERGEKSISVDSLWRVAKALGTRVRNIINPF
jgi:transcriptional regulator with XRE-family HTH domain